MAWVYPKKMHARRRLHKRGAIESTLDQHAGRKRWCSRSKPWWNLELQKLRRELGTTEGQPV